MGSFFFFVLAFMQCRRKTWRKLNIWQCLPAKTWIIIENCISYQSWIVAIPSQLPSFSNWSNWQFVDSSLIYSLYRWTFVQWTGKRRGKKQRVFQWSAAKTLNIFFVIFYHTFTILFKIYIFFRKSLRNTPWQTLLVQEW